MEIKLRVIIAGSRTFVNYSLLKRKLIQILFDKYKAEEIEIVSGRARGADSLGERFAQEFGCKLKYFPADWDRYGKSAGYRRNAEMANYSNACVVFWDGESTGSKHMIDLVKKHELKLRIIKYNKEECYEDRTDT